MTRRFDGFPPDTLRFLTSLKRNNNREWFQKNRDRYEAAFLQPALAFIEAIDQPLRTVSPCLQAVPEKVGGSLMRIYRDTRFSKDKTPYKTNIGIHFRHVAGCDIHAPGCYVHIEPKGVFLGVGIWHPDTKTLSRIRRGIDEDPAGWKRSSAGKSFRSRFSLIGDSLKRPPAGYSADHPLIEDLKRKDFIGHCPVVDEAIMLEHFVDHSVETFRAARPLMRFLCRTLDLPF